jgi:hypothetical protein
MGIEIRFYPEHVFQLAEEFFDAQQRLSDREKELGIYRPRYLLFCQCIELALKAFIAQSCGITNDDQQVHIHGLDKLLEKAKGHGLVLSKRAEDSICMLANAHHKSWARYVRYDIEPIFTLDQFSDGLVELMTIVCRSVRGGDFRQFVDY